MAVLKRAKQTTAQLARAQRRIWLVQTLFWPLVVTGSILTATIWLTLRKKRTIDQPIAAPAVLE